jgi:hypothetical protein
MIIYKTTNLLNGKIYVGKDSKNNPDYYGSGVAIKEAIKRLGKENFKKEIIEYCTADNINEREIYWIEQTNCRDLSIGYNLAPGGDGGGNLYDYHPDADGIRERISKTLRKTMGTDEYRKKCSIRAKEFMNRPETKEHFSKIQKVIQNRPEMKEMVSKTHKGRKRSETTKLNISNGQLRYLENPENMKKIMERVNIGMNSPERLRERSEAMKGKGFRKTPYTEEERAKMAETTKTLWEDPEYRERVKANRKKALDEGRGKKSQEAIKEQQERQFKKIYQYDTEWNLVQIWPSMKSVKEHYKNNIIKRWSAYYLDKDKLMEGSYWRRTYIENIG